MKNLYIECAFMAIGTALATWIAIMAKDHGITFLTGVMWVHFSQSLTAVVKAWDEEEADER